MTGIHVTINTRENDATNNLSEAWEISTDAQAMPKAKTNTVR